MSYWKKKKRCYVKKKNIFPSEKDQPWGDISPNKTYRGAWSGHGHKYIYRHGPQLVCIFPWLVLQWSGGIRKPDLSGCKPELLERITLTSAAFYTTRWRNCTGKNISTAVEALQSASLMTKLGLCWFLWKHKRNNKSQRTKAGFQTQGSDIQVVMTIDGPVGVCTARVMKRKKLRYYSQDEEGLGQSLAQRIPKLSTRGDLVLPCNTSRQF